VVVVLSRPVHRRGRIAGGGRGGAGPVHRGLPGDGGLPPQRRSAGVLLHHLHRV